ncbi:hypothetical protein J2X36_002937 [Methylobacterium sp. BE186]|nr:hypothetical protein [Methylobacterium sp. BE186]
MIAHSEPADAITNRRVRTLIAIIARERRILA